MINKVFVMLSSGQSLARDAVKKLNTGIRWGYLSGGGGPSALGQVLNRLWEKKGGRAGSEEQLWPCHVPGVPPPAQGAGASGWWATWALLQSASPQQLEWELEINSVLVKVSFINLFFLLKQMGSRLLTLLNTNTLSEACPGKIFLYIPFSVPQKYLSVSPMTKVLSSVIT